MAKVALLGTGRMGAAMASRLVGSGHQLVLWNRTTATAAELADRLGPSVQVAPDPAAAVARCGLVLSVFADGDTTCAVLLDAVRAESWLPGVVVCDLGTSGLDAAKALSAGLRTAGVGFVDAPVSGSVPTVLAGELLVMASGDEHDVALLRPVLAAFARKVMFVGPAGSGQIMKLSVNLVVHGLNAVVSEALQLAESTGIARKDAYDVLQESVVAAPFVKYKRAAFLDDTQPVAMSLNLVHKDLTLIAGLAASTGSRVPVTASVARAVGDALDEGMGALDMAALSHPEASPPGDLRSPRDLGQITVRVRRSYGRVNPLLTVMSLCTVPENTWKTATQEHDWAGGPGDVDVDGAGHPAVRPSVRRVTRANNRRGCVGPAHARRAVVRADQRE